MMGVDHKVDSEDLVHCDLMAICAFFIALLMRGLQFKQALAVVNRVGNSELSCEPFYHPHPFYQELIFYMCSCFVQQIRSQRAR